MYGMVFDNTHSKQLSKNVTFVVMTHPTSAPPKSGQQISFKQAMGRDRAGSTGRRSPSLVPVDYSNEMLAPPTKHKASMPELQRKSSRGVEWDKDGESTFYTGILSKKRRKKNQGWARRFFSLDFTSSTLSYYRTRNSSALRGSIPLPLAAVAVDENTRHISVDSGAEIWILRAANRKDLEGWWGALEKASQRQYTPPSSHRTGLTSLPYPSGIEDKEWDQAETIASQVAGITDNVRQLAKDTDPKYSPNISGLAISNSPAGSPTPTETEGDDYFNVDVSSSHGRSPFNWRRKSSFQSKSPSGVLARSVSAQKQGSSSLAIPTPKDSLHVTKSRSMSKMNSSSGLEDVHDQCMAILRDLDTVVANFSSLFTECRQRRQPERPAATQRNSMDSTFSQAFFDADDGLHRSGTQILRIRGDSDPVEDSPERPEEAAEVEDSESESDLDEAEEGFASTGRPGETGLFPSKPKSLVPLPKPPTTRRSIVPASIGQPPSLIAFLRKNVGKDLSTISMPVTANEPLSLLQRQAEQMEYSELLDSAVTAPANTGERLLHITAFALSSLSNSRLKDRAIRKPFNPMLGETYELVREDKGFRYLSEKISHRPVRVSCHAEAKEWTFNHSPSPTQKFWGKSAEINTDGKARVRLHASGDCYSWTPATCFLRNIIAGEKYVEPVSSMTVIEETSGRKAVATFKAGGMFSGRSEDVTVQVTDSSGQTLPFHLVGKWTTHLTLTNQAHGSAASEERDIWKVGPLVKDAPKHYGMTAFAATLNEVTSIEADGKALPPTDSRKRPDQRKYENGDVDGAEKMKAQLEEAQRRRRKEMEMQGEEWHPRWFEKAGQDGDEDVWKLKGEKDGSDYWNVREAVVGFKHGQWDGVREVFEL